MNLPGLTETYTISPYQSPCSGPPAVAPPGPFTVTRRADGTLTLLPSGYSASILLSGQEMLQINMSITCPSMGQTRTRRACWSRRGASANEAGCSHSVVSAAGPEAFTLMEVMVASTMTAVLLVCVLCGVVSLQHSYAAIEEYAAGQADQSRLLDCLALDLRRSIQLNGSANCYTVDPDGQGLKITVPDLYRFAANDPQHLFPIIVVPTYDATTQTAYYNGSAATVPAGGLTPPKSSPTASTP